MKKAQSEKHAHWLGKLANLNAAKTPGLGIAPHKPLMIFSVMDLIATYFTPPEQASLCERFRLPVPDTAEMAEFAKDREAFKASQKKGRNIRFRAEVGSGYKYICALTGYCLQCTRGYIVQACHIHEHSKSGNDDPRNGLALTPDAHWMFDAGLWTAEPRGKDFVVRVAKGRFQEGSVAGRTLLGWEGNPLWFDPRARLRPGVEFLEWHRRSVFKSQRLGKVRPSPPQAA